CSRRFQLSPAAIVVVSLALLQGTMPSSAIAQAGESGPVYKAAPCCSLCPRAADPSVYVSRFMRDHRITIQGTGDWLFRTEVDLDTEFAVDEAVYADLSRMVRELNARGTQILLLDLPRRGLLAADKLLPANRERYDRKTTLTNYRRMLQRFRDIGFIVPDYGLLAEQPDGAGYFFHRDGHWTPDGARRTARLIADAVMAQPFYGGLRRKAFKTRQVGQQRHPGVLSIVASQICGGNFPSEVVSGFVTSPSETFPFADEPVPDVTLVGTSFSALPAYHFAGFLQQDLQTDVYNASLSGGNFDGAMTQYLPSAAFQENPPKLLIWEFAHPQIAAATTTQLRRLIPLVENGCIGQEPLLKNEVPVTSGGDFTEVLFNGGGAIISAKSRELVVDLQFADPGIGEILSEIWYLDGKHEVVRVRMNDYTRANGRFVLELNREPDYSEQPLIDFRVQIVTPLSGATSVSATLCRRAEPSKTELHSRKGAAT
ncbi:MAG: alginate biosynthesis protein AlgX, partial [Gammaproteobacteria bacterium]